MKKNILSLIAIALMATASIFTGCKKDDTTAPVVTLTGGAASQTISLQGTYTELGATANDDKDGALTPTTSGSVNVNLTGTYIITYSATDAAGNTGTATRTITVVNDAAGYAGTYDCTDASFGSGSPWTQVITASTTTNNHIVFSKFAERTGNNTIEAALTGGTAFTVIGATVSGLGANACTFTYAANGAGATITQAGGKYSFSVKYFESEAGGGACTAVSVTPFEDTMVQQ
jgi:hypothetical protein